MHPLQLLISLADIVAPLFLDRFSAKTARALRAHRTQTANCAAPGPRSTVAVGAFDNRTRYLRGAFLDATDHLSSQARTILIAHLQQTERFEVLDRESRAQTQTQAQDAPRGAAPQRQGADYVVTGGISQFGRKDVGDTPLFRALGCGNGQIAHAQVTLDIVDMRTAAVVRSVQGAGEYPLSNREVLVFGGSAGDDATLSGKVLELAIREAVGRLAEIVDAGLLPAQPALPQAVL